MFLALLILVSLSFVLPSVSLIHKSLVGAFIVVAFVSFSTSYLFNLYTMRFYKNADWKDHLIRLVIIPEFLYSNFLALVLLGAYPFYAYTKLFGKIKIMNPLYNGGLRMFNKVGYSLTWGTRKIEEVVV